MAEEGSLITRTAHQVLHRAGRPSHLSFLLEADFRRRGRIQVAGLWPRPMLRCELIGGGRGVLGLDNRMALRPIEKKMAFTHSSAKACSTIGVVGQGPSSKVSTTSPGCRKSYILKCSKPKPGPAGGVDFDHARHAECVRILAGRIKDSCCGGCGRDGGGCDRPRRHRWCHRRRRAYGRGVRRLRTPKRVAHVRRRASSRIVKWQGCRF